jgi:hypothetical protein
MNDDERPDAPETRPSKPAEDNKGTLERIGPDDLLPPASSRKPRSRKDELPLDDGLPGILDPEAEHDLLAESEERPPASRKVASQRGSDKGFRPGGPNVEQGFRADDLATWDIDGISGEAPPTRKAPGSGSTRGETRVVVERAPTTSTPVDRDVVLLAPPSRVFRPVTFGELLDDALSLGRDDD